jgi:hypothetical protein
MGSSMLELKGVAVTPNIKDFSKNLNSLVKEL